MQEVSNVRPISWWQTSRRVRDGEGRSKNRIAFLLYALPHWMKRACCVDSGTKTYQVFFLCLQFVQVCCHCHTVTQQIQGADTLCRLPWSDGYRAGTCKVLPVTAREANNLTLYPHGRNSGYGRVHGRCSSPNRLIWFVDTGYELPGLRVHEGGVVSVDNSTAGADPKRRAGENVPWGYLGLADAARDFRTTCRKRLPV